MIKYVLSENLLTARPDDFMATPVDVKSFDRDTIVEMMLKRGTLLTKTDILAVLNSLEEVVADIVKDGGAVNMPLFNTSFSISGVFDGAMDVFDPNRHRLYVNLNKGTLLRDVEKQVKTSKTETSTAAPSIIEVRDVLSGTSNEKLTPRGVIQVFGSGLRIEGTDAAVGLWFVPAEGAQPPVKTDVLVSNKPSSLTAMIPALDAGIYRIRVATQYAGSGSRLLKMPRVTTWEKVFVVG